MNLAVVRLEWNDVVLVLYMVPAHTDLKIVHVYYMANKVWEGEIFVAPFFLQRCTFVVLYSLPHL